jgi:DNA polymerase-4
MRKIIHIDMDCFYAAVEVKRNPRLAGKPLGIGGPPNSRSVLCTASYEARKFGVRSAMPSSQAVRLCPQLILIPPDFTLYKKESRAVREILERFTKRIEPLSLDEAYLDVTDCPQFDGSATLLAAEIRKTIWAERGLTASAGAAPNKFLAKIASDWKKPNGQFVIRPQEVEAFVKTLPIEKIWGVGKVTARHMHEKGIHTCEDLQKYSIPELKRWFGSRGEDLYNLSRGIDHREVCTDFARKSLTVEETFREDRRSLEEGLAALPELYEEWCRRMDRSGEVEKIRGFVVKVKYHDFKTSTHETSAQRRPELSDFQNLFREIWKKRSEPIRLLGLGVRMGSAEGSRKESSPQLSFLEGID